MVGKQIRRESWNEAPTHPNHVRGPRAGRGTGGEAWFSPVAVVLTIPRAPPQEQRPRGTRSLSWEAVRPEREGRSPEIPPRPITRTNELPTLLCVRSLCPSLMILSQMLWTYLSNGNCSSASHTILDTAGSRQARASLPRPFPGSGDGRSLVPALPPSLALREEPQEDSLGPGIAGPRAGEALAGLWAPPPRHGLTQGLLRCGEREPGPRGQHHVLYPLGACAAPSQILSYSPRPPVALPPPPRARRSLGQRLLSLWIGLEQVTVPLRAVSSSEKEWGVCLRGMSHTRTYRCTRSPWTEIQVSRDSLLGHPEPGMQLALNIC